MEMSGREKSTYTRRIVRMGEGTSDATVERGLQWYPKVHEATTKGAKSLGISTHHASGIVAAVSPNMDWERNNISALDEIANIKPEHWDMVARSANQPRVPSSASGGMSRARRIPEVGEMLREVAPSLSAASDESLMKAHRILNGANFHEVLNQRSAPKTNRFAQNIENPSNPHPATIDGRQADIIEDKMRGWSENRGISSAGLTVPTRYEHFEGVMRSGAEILGRRDPRFKGANASAVQAVTWERGKEIERSFPTKSGKPRKQSPTRAGQSYQRQSGS